MSKVREQFERMGLGRGEELAFEQEGDLQPFVIFTQLKEGGPHVYAGWVDAADEQMALDFGCEHYGQDQACTNIWAIPRQFIAGMRMNLEAAKEAVPEREYILFTQKEAGDQHLEGPRVRATSAHEALQTAPEAIDNHAELHNVWAVPAEEIISTPPGAMIWRETDQTYRLARGYSKGVKEKWTQIRKRQDLETYEKDDLKETF